MVRSADWAKVELSTVCVQEKQKTFVESFEVSQLIIAILNVLYVYRQSKEILFCYGMTSKHIERLHYVIKNYAIPCARKVLEDKLQSQERH